MHMAVMRSTKELEMMSQEHESLELELDALHASRRRWEGSLRDSVDRDCPGYSGLMRTHVTS